MTDEEFRKELIRIMRQISAHTFWLAWGVVFIWALLIGGGK
jgi:hypothetical protein